MLYSLCDSAVVEEMFYGPKIASRGEMSEWVSLERILFTRPALTPDNWHVARPEQGNATPGRPNSVRVECDLPIEEREGETLTPEQIAALTLYALQDPANNATLHTQRVSRCHLGTRCHSSVVPDLSQRRSYSASQPTSPHALYCLHPAHYSPTEQAILLYHCPLNP